MDECFDIFLQFLSLISFGKVSSPKRMSAKNPVISMALKSKSSCWIEEERSVRTRNRSLNVKALFRDTAEPVGEIRF